MRQGQPMPPRTLFARQVCRAKICLRTLTHTGARSQPKSIQMATKVSGRQGQGRRPAAVSQNKPTSGVKTTHPPGTQPPTTTPGSTSGRSSTSPAATSHAATTSQELTWATVQSVRAQLGASHPIAVEVARLYSEQERSKGAAAGVHRQQQPTAAVSLAPPCKWANQKAVLDLTDRATDMIFQGSQQRQQAIKLLKDAQREVMTSLPRNHFSIPLISVPLSTALFADEQWQACLTQSRWMLPRMIATEGPDSGYVSILRRQIADCLFELDRYADAVPEYRWCWEDKQRSGQASAPDSAPMLVHLFQCYIALSPALRPPADLIDSILPTAVPAAQRSKDTKVKMLWLDVILECRMAVFDAKGTQKVLQELLPLVKQVHGPEHPKYLGYTKNMVTALITSQQWGKAQSMAFSRLHTLRRLHGLQHTETIQAAVSLGQCYNGSGKLQEAISVFKEVWDTAIRALGPGDSVVLLLYRTYSSVLTELGLRKEAKALEQDARRRGFQFKELNDLMLSVMPIAGEVQKAVAQAQQPGR